MASPFKTHETMDLARALLEEDSESYTSHPTNIGLNNNNEEVDPPKPLNLRFPIDPNEFGNLVVSKESSTDLIHTEAIEEPSTNTTSTHKTLNRSKPAMTLVRDVNAGTGILDEDGKPAVAKVFSRVIHISGPDNKPKQLKAHHRGRSSSSCCRDRHGVRGQDKERSLSARPQSGQQQRLGGQGRGSSRKKCPTCEQQFSDETVMEQHIVFCTGSSKEIM